MTTASERSVRELVADAQDQMLHDLTPMQARDLLVRLTSLLGNALTEVMQADHAYGIVLLKFLESDEAANRAKIRAECSLEYIRKKEAATAHTVLLESIRSLKAYLRSSEEEMRLTR